ncbi:hypothetical protein LSTR_LSTR014888 [Laodelphax striatellus]|uniref:Uncharacterized protein n=1 Tax=Laodelphax striatellus TaxID=195883 RepID=A0A482WYL5_LAOST|nr:hypothetical protein LSTR_LSTR014888 [Laodelphax striatellus]
MKSFGGLSMVWQRLMGSKAELLDAVRRRRMREEQTSEEEEDLGLPRSPFSASSTTTDILIEKVLKVDLKMKLMIAAL